MKHWKKHWKLVVILLVVGIWTGAGFSLQASGQEAFGRQWARTMTFQDWNRFYHYPYVYYPQNFWGPDYYRSSEDLYYRYPPEMRIPVYNKRWQNFYPMPRAYHQGHHFILDVF